MIAAIVINTRVFLGVINVVNTLGVIYTFIIFGWALLSWFKRRRGVISDIYNLLDKLAGPFVRLFRRFVPAVGGLDFTPLIAMVVVQLTTQLLLLVFSIFFSPY